MPHERYAPMRTDWALVRRLAFELEARFRGSRVQDAGTLDDSRPALMLWSRGTTSLLCFDLFGSPPLVTVETGQLGTASEPSFVRTLAKVLRGRVVDAIEARPHDRLLKFTFRTRSRFGVDDEVDLYIELVPRFGNAVLAKNGRVIAAAQEFDPAHSARATMPGAPYVLPPLPQTKVAPAIADVEAAMREPLYVYRHDGRLAQISLFPLPEVRDAVLSRETSLLELLSQERGQRLGSQERARTLQRRTALQRRLGARLRKNDASLGALAAHERELEGRETLRLRGERMYATLHELDPLERPERKREAGELFARYRKLSDALPHVARRRERLEREREALDMLQWEVEHVSDQQLTDIENAAAWMRPGTHRKAPAPARRKRQAMLEWRTPHGSRVLVGRSPVENAELTFRIAGPNDLWFHVRGAPGAHVVLTRDDRSAPPEEDIAFAASLAAGHSKAAQNAKVTVDYTQRKHVRKQPDAPPGLVFYTNATSITVAPQTGR